MLPPFAALVSAVRARLGAALPGHAAHAEMAPYPRRTKPEVISVEGKDGRPAATLLLLYPEADGAAHFALTVRQPSLRAHSGQVSLPGGSLEPGETPEDAARREAFEEVGVDPEAVEILGRLTPLYIPPSGFSVWPVVAATPRRPSFVAQEAEVAALVEVPVAHLLDPAMRRHRARDLGGQAYEVPFFRLGGQEVWGATAMMLAEAAVVLADATRSSRAGTRPEP
ncbi:MAG: CoA pyrophosphatase [Bacteroidota bacterium]